MREEQTPYLTREDLGVINAEEKDRIAVETVMLPVDVIVPIGNGKTECLPIHAVERDGQINVSEELYLAFKDFFKLEALQ